MKSLITVLALLFSPLLFAQPALHSDLPLRYLEQPGNGAPDQPLVIFLHGYGSNEADLFGLKDDLLLGATYLSVRAPMQMAEDGYQWFTPVRDAAEYNGLNGDVESSEQRIVDFIAAAVAKYHTRADQVILVGFSQGAILSYQVALHHPQSVGGIAALSGKLLPPLRASLKADSRYGAVRFFIGHGTADTVLPVQSATQADQSLQAIGVVPQIHLYEGLRHSISEAEVTELRDWIAQGQR